MELTAECDGPARCADDGATTDTAAIGTVAARWRLVGDEECGDEDEASERGQQSVLDLVEPAEGVPALLLPLRLGMGNACLWITVQQILVLRHAWREEGIVEWSPERHDSDQPEKRRPRSVRQEVE